MAIGPGSASLAKAILSAIGRGNSTFGGQRSAPLIDFEEFELTTDDFIR
jgi:hypothetical protein